MWTNRGKQRMFEEFFEASSVATDFRLQLASATVPEGNSTWGSNVSSTSQVVLVSALEVGTSGLLVPRSTTTTSGFDVSSWIQISPASAARAVLKTEGDVYQYSGTITGAKYVLLTEFANTPAGTFDASGAEIYAWWDIGDETNITAGNTLTITNLSLQAN
jgi:hypothetical protein